MPDLVEIVPPFDCPECRTPLEESDEGGAGILIHCCPNARCPGRIRGTLTFIGSREILEIDNLGPESATSLIKFGVHDLGELYTFQSEALTSAAVSGEEAFVEHMRKAGFDITILKLVKSLERAKTASWGRWIAAMGIPMIGRTLGKPIATALDLGPEDMANLPGKLLLLPKLGVEGLGEAKLGSICEWANDPSNQKMCYTLYERGIRPMSVEKPKASAPLSGVIFCITGAFAEGRDSITKKLESLGAVAKSSVSKKINLLIVGDDAGSKLDKAKSLGIRTVGGDWLAKTLAENGLA